MPSISKSAHPGHRFRRNKSAIRQKTLNTSLCFAIIIFPIRHGSRRHRLGFGDTGRTDSRRLFQFSSQLHASASSDYCRSRFGCQTRLLLTQQIQTDYRPRREKHRTDKIKYKSLKYNDLYLIFHRFSILFIDLAGVHEVLLDIIIYIRTYRYISK